MQHDALRIKRKATMTMQESDNRTFVRVRQCEWHMLTTYDAIPKYQTSNYHTVSLSHKALVVERPKYFSFNS